MVCPASKHVTVLLPSVAPTVQKLPCLAHPSLLCLPPYYSYYSPYTSCTQTHLYSTIDKRRQASTTHHSRQQTCRPFKQGHVLSLFVCVAMHYTHACLNPILGVSELARTHRQ